MTRSLAISALAHLAILILLLFAGQLFRAEHARAIQVTEVEIVTAPAPMPAPADPPAAPREAPAALPQPEAREDAPAAPDDTAPPRRSDAARPGADAADSPPHLAGLRPDQTATVTLEAPPAPLSLAEDSHTEGESPLRPERIGPALPELARRRPDASRLTPPAPPAPAPRIAPTPAPKPPAPARPAEEASPELAPSPDAAEPREERPAAAPPEAATEIVPEAERAPERPESAAPLASAPPPRRPARSEPARAEDRPAPAPARAAADPAPARPAPAAAPASSRPAGPPVTAAEKAGITLPIRKYWNFGTLRGVEGWEKLVVSVRFQVAPDGSLIGDVVPHDPANPQGNFRRAFEAARRAILIAARRGEIRFPPQEKYERWKDIIITFDPKSQDVGF
ncbi:MAG: hypothetical protein KatS3mg118_1947 [Paracoccaceae bacterium]|nr:MAG: hypothetical protein KatS3mg118_1947 [Paracoccaceae bacterium]